MEFGKRSGKRRRSVSAGVALTMLGIAAGLIAQPSPAVRTARLSDPNDAKGRLDIRAANVTQSGKRLRIAMRVTGAFSLADLKGRPSFSEAGSQNYVCVELAQQAARRACFGTDSHGARRLYEAGVKPGGASGPWRAVPVNRIARPSRRSISARLTLGSLHLRPGALRWRVLSDSDQTPCATANACVDVAPDSGFAHARLIRPHIVACRVERKVFLNGSRSHRRIALTFDDGPSDYTSSVLRILRRKHAKATFFVLGNQIRGRSELLRRALREGNELGNHSTYHRAYPSAGDLAITQRKIHRATDFTPCNFRPPYGAINSAVAAGARRDGLASIVWDTDTRDWTRPGSGTIAARATSVRAGSIVLMHDGGGPRNQTVAALPGIIRRLHRRHFKLVTVTQLLGGREIYAP